jgi:hypothetical protein
MVKIQTTYINLTIQKQPSTFNGILYNTEIPDLIFVIKCLLHDYFINDTRVVSGS